MPFVNANATAAGIVGGDQIPVRELGAKRRVAHAVFTFATDAAGTYTIPVRIPAGAVVEAVDINTSVTTGTATIAIGITGAVGKYRAAAAVTSTDLWVGSGAAAVGGALNAICGVPLAVEEQLIMTTASATLPASGRMVIRVTYVDNS